ncbi:hypothetical protein MMC17_006985 [Xylographa soralifera]|nr:hypothetical protein [Xylographa soralifera]
MGGMSAVARRSLPGNLPHSSTPPPFFSVDPAARNKASMAGSSVWKTIFIPPLVALAIFLVIVYILLPLYRQRQRYAHYIPVSLPPAYSPTGQQNFISRTRQRVLNAITPSGAGNRWGRRGSQMSADSMFGDEELEEGFGIEGVPEERGRRGSEVREDRRLSRDLEVGFRDDSDEDDPDASTTELGNNGTGGQSR